MRTLTNSQLHRLKLGGVDQIVCADHKDIYVNNVFSHQLCVFVTYRIIGTFSPIIYKSEITMRSTKAGRRSKETQAILDDMLENMINRNCEVIEKFGMKYVPDASHL